MANGYKEGLTIDRIDVDGNYEPDNCRWTTHKEQSRNRRNNHLLTYNGETKPICEWTELIGLNEKIIWKRIYRGWSVEKALTTPKLH